jgi:hypothetical protein
MHYPAISLQYLVIKYKQFINSTLLLARGQITFEQFQTQYENLLNIPNIRIEEFLSIEDFHLYHALLIRRMRIFRSLVIANRISDVRLKCKMASLLNSNARKSQQYDFLFFLSLTKSELEIIGIISDDEWSSN